MNLILGFILMGITIWEISFNLPFPMNRGWDSETTPYFFKWITIGLIALILILTGSVKV
jgi:hypothetical protein